MQTFRCPDCKEIILIVMEGDEVDETEFNTKVHRHNLGCPAKLDELYNLS